MHRFRMGYVEITASSVVDLLAQFWEHRHHPCFAPPNTWAVYIHKPDIDWAPKMPKSPWCPIGIVRPGTTWDEIEERAKVWWDIAESYDRLSRPTQG